MNVKKQLNKIRDYVEELVTLIDKQQTELHQYKLTAHKFVNDETASWIAKEEFRKLLGDTIFIGGNFCGDVMEKMVDNVWQPIEHEHPEYAKVVDENARLREALRWHPASELPDKVSYVCHSSKNVILNSTRLPYKIAYYSYLSGIWRESNNSSPIDVDKNSRWCYIPEDKDGE